MERFVKKVNGFLLLFLQKAPSQVVGMFLKIKSTHQNKKRPGSTEENLWKHTGNDEP